MKRALVAAVVLSVGLGSAAQAGPITYNFTVRLSEFTDSSNFFGGALAPGSDLAGSFTYDGAAVDVNPHPDAGYYVHSGAPYGGFVTGGGVTFSVSNPTDSFSTRVVNDVPPYGDAIGFVFDRVATAPADFCTAQGGCSSNGWMAIDLKSSTNPWNSQALPLVLPSLDVFGERRFVLLLTGANGAQVLALGEVTSLTPSSAVPEAGSTLVLLGLGLALVGLVVWRRRR